MIRRQVIFSTPMIPILKLTDTKDILALSDAGLEREGRTVRPEVAGWPTHSREDTATKG